jgi:histidyl-tRNA synthetase
MGGPATPGIGWAGGIERLGMLVGEDQPAVRPIALVAIGEAAEKAALTLSDELRRAGFFVELTYRGNLKRRMTRADRLNARAAVILGEEELATGTATLRDLDDGTQAKVPLAGLKDHLGHFA